MHYTIFRVIFQETDLLLQFYRVMPVVVAMAYRDIFSFAGFDGITKISKNFFIGFFGQYSYNAGEFFLVFESDISCAICRAVIADNDLKCVAAFLIENTLHCLAYIVFLVVRHECNTHHRVTCVHN